MPEIKNFPDLCKSLAVEMTARTGEIWRTVEDAQNWTHIESPTACLSLRDDWRTHRLAIHATAPNATREKTTGETITCDPERRPEAIARDIETRLLAHARQHLAESKEYDRKRRQEAAEKNLRLSFLRKYLPREHQPDKLCNADSMKRANIYAQLTYENLVELEITLPLKQALQILEILKGL